MGLLSLLFGGRRDNDKPDEAERPVEAAVNRPSTVVESRDTTKAPPHNHTRRSLVLDGDCERTVYTYDGAPLKGTRKGSVFYADVVTRRVKLTSPLTGSVWDTGQDGGVALAVNGSVFGATNTLDTTFHELASRGYSIRVKVKRLGMYDRGIPDVVMMLPEPNEVIDWNRACLELEREIPFNERNSQECLSASGARSERRSLEFKVGHDLPRGVSGVSIYLDEWNGIKDIDGLSKVYVSTSWVPMPKGSSAKPHILVKEGAKEVAEITARKSSYATLSEHVGEHPLEAVCQRKESERDDRGYYWVLTMVFAPKVN